MAFNWGEFLKHSGQGVRRAGEGYSRLLTSRKAEERAKLGDDLKRQQLLQSKTLMPEMQAQAEEKAGARTALGGYREGLRALTDPDATMGFDKRTGEAIKAPGPASLGERKQISEGAGLGSFRATLPQIESIEGGIEREEAIERGGELQEKTFGFKEKELGLKQQAIDSRAQAARDKIKFDFKKAMETAGERNIDREINLSKTFKGDKKVLDYQKISYAHTAMTAAWTDYEARKKEAIKKGEKIPQYGAVDQTMITLFNKMLDPSSVVRESEYARTPENAAYMDMLLGKLKAMKEGGAGLLDDFREELMTVADTLYNAAENGLSKTVEAYASEAGQWGLRASTITGEYGYLLKGAGEGAGKTIKTGKYTGTVEEE